MAVVAENLDFDFEKMVFDSVDLVLLVTIVDSIDLAKTV